MQAVDASLRGLGGSACSIRRRQGDVGCGSSGAQAPGDNSEIFQDLRLEELGFGLVVVAFFGAPSLGALGLGVSKIPRIFGLRGFDPQGVSIRKLVMLRVQGLRLEGCEFEVSGFGA